MQARGAAAGAGERAGSENGHGNRIGNGHGGRHGQVQKYAEVTITGAWKEVYTLRADQVDDTVLLDLSNRGTCKLAGPKIPKDKWVRDVTTIEVR